MIGAGCKPKGGPEPRASPWERRIPRLIQSAFLRLQKCHAPRARNRQCHGALPLIKQAALAERDTLINALPSTPGVARAYGQQLGLQPAPIIFQITPRSFSPFQIVPKTYKTLMKSRINIQKWQKNQFSAKIMPYLFGRVKNILQICRRRKLLLAFLSADRVAILLTEIHIYL